MIQKAIQKIFRYIAHIKSVWSLPPIEQQHFGVLMSLYEISSYRLRNHLWLNENEANEVKESFKKYKQELAQLYRNRRQKRMIAFFTSK